MHFISKFILIYLISTQVISGHLIRHSRQATNETNQVTIAVTEKEPTLLNSEIENDSTEAEKETVPAVTEPSRDSDDTAPEEKETSTSAPIEEFSEIPSDLVEDNDEKGTNETPEEKATEVTVKPVEEKDVLKDDNEAETTKGPTEVSPEESSEEEEVTESTKEVDDKDAESLETTKGPTEVSPEESSEKERSEEEVTESPVGVDDKDSESLGEPKEKDDASESSEAPVTPDKEGEVSEGDILENKESSNISEKSEEETKDVIETESETIKGPSESNEERPEEKDSDTETPSKGEELEPKKVEDSVESTEGPITSDNEDGRAEEENLQSKISEKPDGLENGPSEENSIKIDNSEKIEIIDQPKLLENSETSNTTQIPLEALNQNETELDDSELKHKKKDCPKNGLWFQRSSGQEELVLTTQSVGSTEINMVEIEDLESEIEIHHHNACSFDEMKPIKFTCLGEPICAYIGCIYLLLMILFNLVKNISLYGCRKIFDLRLHGTSFPQRPELIVIICSTLPMIFVSISRPIFPKLNYYHELFIFGAGFPQIRAFFDYFTRSATLYHMIYWAYRMPIINLIWKIFMFTRLKFIAFKERKNDEMQFSSKKFRRGRRRRRKRPRQGNVRQQPKKQQIKAPNLAQKPLPPGERRKKARRRKKLANNNANQPSNDLNSNKIWSMMGNSGMINDNMMNGMQMGNFGGAYMGQDASIFMNDFFNMDDGDGNNDEEKALEDEIIIPEITREFIILCKRIIPGVIYGFSFLVNLPVLADFEQYYSDQNSFMKSKPKLHIYRRFLVYDIVFLMAIPMISVLFAFFYGTVREVQLNGEPKLTYKIKCYYVTYIVLNLPIFILYIIYLSMDFVPGYKFGTCLIISLAIYHTNFILKSSIHGTGCNLLCCTDNYFKSHKKLKNWIDDMTTPILIRQKRNNERNLEIERKK